jgi:hypothetical protein
MAKAIQAFIKNSMELKDGYTRIQKGNLCNFIILIIFLNLTKILALLNHHRHSINLKNDFPHNVRTPL